MSIGLQDCRLAQPEAAAYEANVLEQLYEWTLAVDLDALTCPVKVIGSNPVDPFSSLPSVDT